MTLDDVLTAAGVDVGTTLARFANNRSLYERIVRKFPEDRSFELLREAINAKLYEDVERAAHTLKGVAGNLGFSRLSLMCGDAVTMIREGRGEQAEELFKSKIEGEYALIIKALSELS